MCLEHVINRSEVADRGYKTSGKNTTAGKAPSFPQVLLQALAYFLNIPALIFKYLVKDK